VSNTIALEEEMTKIAAVPHSVPAMLRGYSIEVNPGQAKVVDAAVEREQVVASVQVAGELRIAAQVRIPQPIWVAVAGVA